MNTGKLSKKYQSEKLSGEKYVTKIKVICFGDKSHESVITDKLYFAVLSRMDSKRCSVAFRDNFN